eukprot:NODE_18_length_47517_cov_0.674814.p13 type:complete len:318 gc:universal NODE_18_length_47517_cov_0.674814:37087-36134(-)
MSIMKAPLSETASRMKIKISDRCLKWAYNKYLDCQVKFYLGDRYLKLLRFVNMLPDLILKTLIGLITTALMSIICLTRFYFVFKKKKNRLSKLIILGTLACLIHSSSLFLYTVVDTTFAYNDQSPENISLDGVISLTWLLMIQLEFWVYITRMTSLGSYMWFDKYIKYLPFLVLLLQVPVSVGIGLEMTWQENYEEAAEMLFVALSVGIIIMEIILDTLLIKKLRFIMEFKRNTLQKLSRFIILFCVMVVILESTLIVSCILSPVIYLCARPVICAFRIYMIVEFFQKLLRDQENSRIDSFQLNEVQNLESFHCIVP